MNILKNNNVYKKLFTSESLRSQVDVLFRKTFFLLEIKKLH